MSIPSEALEKLKTGSFDTMQQEWLDKNTCQITLTSRNEEYGYVFTVKHLYESGEHVTKAKKEKTKKVEVSSLT